ncbi:MAG: PilZ domain-containing protein [Acidobacteriota bacterium]
MINVVIVSTRDIQDQLRGTLLFRSNVARIRASSLDEVRRAAQAGKVDVVLVDATLPEAPALAAALRQEPLTRGLSIAGLGQSEFGLVLLELLESGVNAVLPLPPGADWDDRLMRLFHVPARKVARFPVSFAVGVDRGPGEPFEGRALDLSVHGLLLQSSFPLEVGEDLRLAFDLPGGPVRGTGTVVRLASPEGVGVELTSVEGDGRVQIKRFVESPPGGKRPGL